MNTNVDNVRKFPRSIPNKFLSSGVTDALVSVTFTLCSERRATRALEAMTVFSTEQANEKRWTGTKGWNSVHMSDLKTSGMEKY